VRLTLGWREDAALDFAPNEVTGAIGDSVTVLPIVVAVAVLTELSLAVMLVWFGVFQVVWGLYYGVLMSVEPMKALAALLLAGIISAGELLLAGLLLGVVLLAVGWTRSLDRVRRYIGDPVVRGVQFGVALVLLETAARLGLADPGLAGLAAAVALAFVVAGYWNLSALVVLALGGGVAALQTGVPSPALPPVRAFVGLGALKFTPGTVEATLGQLAMTLGNAALAASVLVAAFPTAMLGVILAVVAVQLGVTSVRETGSRLVVVAIGTLGLLVNLAAAFLVGVCLSVLSRRYGE
jgi:hypothetical protein